MYVKAFATLNLKRGRGGGCKCPNRLGRKKPRVYVGKANRVFINSDKFTKLPMSSLAFLLTPSLYSEELSIAATLNKEMTSHFWLLLHHSKMLFYSMCNTSYSSCILSQKVHLKFHLFYTFIHSFVLSFVRSLLKPNHDMRLCISEFNKSHHQSFYDILFKYLCPIELNFRSKYHTH